MCNLLQVCPMCWYFIKLSSSRIFSSVLIYLIWLLWLSYLLSLISLSVLSLLFHSQSQMSPGNLLWLLPLPSHWSPCFQHCPGLSDVCLPRLSFFCSSSFSFLPLFGPYQLFISYSQSLLGAFLYKCILIIKVSLLFIFLYSPCLFNHPSQRNSLRKTERDRVFLYFPSFNRMLSPAE